MARKSSKTAHVMNLLAGDNAAENSENSKEEAASVNRAATKLSEAPNTIKELTIMAQNASIQTQEGAISPISIIDMSSSLPDPVAELIKDELEKEFPDPDFETPAELDADSSASMQNNAEISDEAESNVLFPNEPDPDLPPEPGQDDLPVDVTDQNTPDNLAAEIELNDLTADTSAEPESNAEEIPPHQAYAYLNVMEQVVKDKVPQYSNMFDVCSCDRCVADITALTLTNLPSKYMVVTPDSVSPLLNYYSNRFSQQVTVELTKACAVVKANPHH